MKIEIKNCVYKVHPIYDLYAANKEGEVIHLARKEPISQKQRNGYMQCTVKKYKQSQKTHYIHRLFGNATMVRFPMIKLSIILMTRKMIIDYVISN